MSASKRRASSVRRKTQVDEAVADDAVMQAAEASPQQGTMYQPPLPTPPMRERVRAAVAADERLLLAPISSRVEPLSNSGLDCVASLTHLGPLVTGLVESLAATSDTDEKNFETPSLLQGDAASGLAQLLAECARLRARPQRLAATPTAAAAVVVAATSPSAPDLSSAGTEEGAYEVQSIVERQPLKRRKGRKGKRTPDEFEYLVHWKGFTKADRTWERLKCLDGCPDLLRAFLAKQDDDAEIDTLLPAAAASPASATVGARLLLDELQEGIVALMAQSTHTLAVQRSWYASLRSNLDAFTSADTLRPLVALATATLTRVFPSTDACPCVDWSTCFIVTQAPQLHVGSAREQSEALLCTPESRTTPILDLAGVCALALDLLSTNHLVADDALPEDLALLRERLVAFASQLLDPRVLAQWLSGDARTDPMNFDLASTTVPMAAVAALLAPVYEVLAFGTPLAVANDLHAALERDQLVHPNEHARALKCCTYDTEGSITLAKKLKTRFLLDDATYTQSSFSCLALDAASMLRYALKKTCAEKRQGVFFDPHNLPPCMKITPPSFAPRDAVRCLHRLVESVQCMNARFLSKSFCTVEYPSWFSLPTATVILTAVRTAVMSAPALSIDAAVEENDGQLDTATLLVVATQLLSAIVPNLQPNARSGLATHPLPRSVVSEPFRMLAEEGASSSNAEAATATSAQKEPVVALVEKRGLLDAGRHCHVLPWLHIVATEARRPGNVEKTGASLLPAYHNLEKYLETFVPDLMQALLELLGTLAEKALQLDEQAQLHLAGQLTLASSSSSSSSAADSSSSLPPVLSVLFSHWFWRELCIRGGTDRRVVEAYLRLLGIVMPRRSSSSSSRSSSSEGKLQRSSSLPPRSISTSESMVVDQPTKSERALFDDAISGSMVLVRALLERPHTSIFPLACGLVQHALARWPVERPMLQTFHTFLLRHLPTLTVTPDEDEEVPLDDQQNDEAAELAATAAAELPRTLELCGMHLAESTIRTSLREVEAAFKEHLPQEDEKMPDQDESAPVPIATVASKLPTWKPLNGCSSRLIGADGDCVNDEADRGEYRPSGSTRTPTAVRRFREASNNPLMLLRLHTAWLRDAVAQWAARTTTRAKDMRSSAWRLARAANRAHRLPLDKEKKARKAQRTEAMQVRKQKAGSHWADQLEQLKRWREENGDFDEDDEEDEVEEQAPLSAIKEESSSSMVDDVPPPPCPIAAASAALLLATSAASSVLAVCMPSPNLEASLLPHVAGVLGDLLRHPSWPVLEQLVPPSSSYEHITDRPIVSSVPQLRIAGKIRHNLVRTLDTCMDACAKEATRAEAACKLVLALWAQAQAQSATSPNESEASRPPSSSSTASAASSSASAASSSPAASSLSPPPPPVLAPTSSVFLFELLRSLRALYFGAEDLVVLDREVTSGGDRPRDRGPFATMVLTLHRAVLSVGHMLSPTKEEAEAMRLEGVTPTVAVVSPAFGLLSPEDAENHTETMKLIVHLQELVLPLLPAAQAYFTTPSAGGFGSPRKRGLPGGSLPGSCRGGRKSKKAKREFESSVLASWDDDDNDRLSDESDGDDYKDLEDFIVAD